MRNAPDALVTVHLLPSERGGRGGPTPDKAFGCIMTIDGVNLDASFRLDRLGALRPGSTDSSRRPQAWRRISEPRMTRHRNWQTQ
jgi:hypothetical protein